MENQTHYIHTCGHVDWIPFRNEYGVVIYPREMPKDYLLKRNPWLVAGNYEEDQIVKRTKNLIGAQKNVLSRYRYKGKVSTLRPNYDTDSSFTDGITSTVSQVEFIKNPCKESAIAVLGTADHEGMHVGRTDFELRVAMANRYRRESRSKLYVTMFNRISNVLEDGNMEKDVCYRDPLSHCLINGMREFDANDAFTSEDYVYLDEYLMDINKDIERVMASDYSDEEKDAHVRFCHAQLVYHQLTLVILYPYLFMPETVQNKDMWAEIKECVGNLDYSFSREDVLHLNSESKDPRNCLKVSEEVLNIIDRHLDLDTAKPVGGDMPDWLKKLMEMLAQFMPQVLSEHKGKLLDGQPEPDEMTNDGSDMKALMATIFNSQISLNETSLTVPFKKNHVKDEIKISLNGTEQILLTSLKNVFKGLMWAGRKKIYGKKGKLSRPVHALRGSQMHSVKNKRSATKGSVLLICLDCSGSMSSQMSNTDSRSRMTVAKHIAAIILRASKVNKDIYPMAYGHTTGWSAVKRATGYKSYCNGSALMRIADGTFGEFEEKCLAKITHGGGNQDDLAFNACYDEARQKFPDQFIKMMIISDAAPSHTSMKHVKDFVKRVNDDNGSVIHINVCPDMSQDGVSSGDFMYGSGNVDYTGDGDAAKLFIGKIKAIFKSIRKKVQKDLFKA